MTRTTCITLGRIKRVEIKKSYAFVEFENVDDAIYAMRKASGSMLEGRTITVRQAGDECMILVWLSTCAVSQVASPFSEAAAHRWLTSRVDLAPAHVRRWSMLRTTTQMLPASAASPGTATVTGGTKTVSVTAAMTVTVATTVASAPRLAASAALMTGGATGLVLPSCLEVGRAPPVRTLCSCCHAITNAKNTTIVLPAW